MSALGGSFKPRFVSHKERRRLMFQKTRRYLSPKIRTAKGMKAAIRREARRRGIPTTQMVRMLHSWT